MAGQIEIQLMSNNLDVASSIIKIGWVRYSNGLLKNVGFSFVGTTKKSGISCKIQFKRFETTPPKNGNGKKQFFHNIAISQFEYFAEHFSGNEKNKIK